MLKILIVDQQKEHQEHLVALLGQCLQPCVVLGQAYDFPSAIHLIHTQQPEIVFLDTDMPHYSGFKLLDFFEEAQFKLVLTTSGKNHALKAFKVEALAYLLKPIQEKELYQCVEKIATLIHPELGKTIQENLNNRFRFTNKNGTYYLKPSEISYIESKGRISDIHLVNGTVLVSNYSLKDCQELLKKTPFLRIHRSFMINLQYMKRYVKGKYILLENDKEIDVGKNFKEDVQAVISYFIK